MKRIALAALAALAVTAALTGSATAGSGGGITISSIVDVSRDQTSQNETPIAINPADSSNMITGANDWNYNDGCAVSTTKDGGSTWTPTTPDGFLPGITKFTNDPLVDGTGAYDAGGDPTIAFSPDGTVAYYVCQAFDFTSPFDIALLLNRSYDGGMTWQKTGLVQVSTFHGNGTTTGSNGKFADHENIHVDPTNGNVYVTWAEFSGNSHSPVYVAASHDQGDTWTLNKVTAGNVKNNQDQRVVTDPSGNAYLVFDNAVNGGKGLTVLYASKSTDGGLSWSTPVQFAELMNPVCVFPTYCFNISGGQFRAGGSYPAPAWDAAHNRLDVLIADIRGLYAQMYVYSLKPDLSLDFTTQIPGGFGDRFMGELSAAPNGRLDASFWDRGYSGNRLVDLTYATSSDGGHTWRQARVTPAGYDPSQWGVPQGAGFRPFIGDYNGIESTNTFAAMTWTGTAPPQPYNLEIDFATATP
jgi:BNR repeat-like domain